MMFRMMTIQLCSCVVQSLFKENFHKSSGNDLHIGHLAVFPPLLYTTLMTSQLEQWLDKYGTAEEEK